MSVAEVLAKAFHDNGVTHIFGVPGGGSSLPVIEAAAQQGIEFVLTRTECAAMIMAAAAAELTGTVGVALTTKGPGLASAANGAAYALLDRSPVLLLTDGFSDELLGYVTHQVFDQQAVMAPLCKGHDRLEGDDVAAAIRQQLLLATAAPQGPVHIELTASTARKIVSIPSEADFSPFNLEPAVNKSEIGEAQRLLASAKRPVVIVGLEARGQEEAESARKLVELLGCPVLPTYKAKGVVSDLHAQYVGLFTGGSAESYCVAQADLIILYGVDPVEFAIQPWRYSAPVIDIASCEHPVHYTKRDVALYGPLHLCVQDLMRDEHVLAETAQWSLNEIATLRHAMNERLQYRCADGISPQQVVEIAADEAEAMRSDSGCLPRITVDAGAHMFSAMAFWPCERAADVLISNGLATMAFALPAAIASACTDPGRSVVAFTGDGGLLMCLGELTTAVELDAQIIVVVFNDQALSLIDIKQQAVDLPTRGVRWSGPNFAAVMDGLGGTGYRVESLEEYRTAIASALRSRAPCLIDVLVNSEGYAEQLKALRG